MKSLNSTGKRPPPCSAPGTLTRWLPNEVCEAVWTFDPVHPIPGEPDSPKLDTIPGPSRIAIVIVTTDRIATGTLMSGSISPGLLSSQKPRPSGSVSPGETSDESAYSGSGDRIR
jgi:hypothetical protein